MVKKIVVKEQNIGEKIGVKFRFFQEFLSLPKKRNREKIEVLLTKNQFIADKFKFSEKICFSTIIFSTNILTLIFLKLIFLTHIFRTKILEHPFLTLIFLNAHIFVLQILV